MSADQAMARKTWDQGCGRRTLCSSNLTTHRFLGAPRSILLFFSLSGRHAVLSLGPSAVGCGSCGPLSVFRYPMTMDSGSRFFVDILLVKQSSKKRPKDRETKQWKRMPTAQPIGASLGQQSRQLILLMRRGVRCELFVYFCVWSLPKAVKTQSYGGLRSNSTNGDCPCGTLKRPFDRHAPSLSSWLRAPSYSQNFESFHCVILPSCAVSLAAPAKAWTKPDRACLERFLPCKSLPARGKMGPTRPNCELIYAQTHLLCTFCLLRTHPCPPLIIPLLHQPAAGL